MQLTQTIRNGITSVVYDVQGGGTHPECAIDTLYYLYGLLFAAEQTEADKRGEATQPIPSDAFTEEDNPLDVRKTKPYLTLTDIARFQGIYYPDVDALRPAAVKAIIHHLKLEPWEFSMSDPDQPLYSSSVTHKVGYWLAENDYPNNISDVNGESYEVRYEGREET